VSTTSQWSLQGRAKVVTTPLRDNQVYYVVYKLACFLVFRRTCGYLPSRTASVSVSLLYLVFRTVGPLVTLLVLNVFLIRALHAARRRHQQMSTSTTTSSRRSRHRENVQPYSPGGADVHVEFPSATHVLAPRTASRSVQSFLRAAHAVSYRSMIFARRRHRENVTLILVVVVSVFIVCQLPDLGLRIAAAVGRCYVAATN